jgi:hypothetical protein
MRKLTDRLSRKMQIAARAILDSYLTDDDIRLMERVDYYCKHPGAYRSEKLSRDAHKRLRRWEEEGAVELRLGDVKVSREFYELMCRVLLDVCVETIDDEGGDEE